MTVFFQLSIYLVVVLIGCSLALSDSYNIQCNKELVHAQRAYMELWRHAGSLESTKEAQELSEVIVQLIECSPNLPSASKTRYTHS